MKYISPFFEGQFIEYDEFIKLLAPSSRSAITAAKINLLTFVEQISDFNYVIYYYLFMGQKTQSSVVSNEIFCTIFLIVVSEKPI